MMRINAILGSHQTCTWSGVKTLSGSIMAPSSILAYAIPKDVKCACYIAMRRNAFA